MDTVLILVGLLLIIIIVAAMFPFSRRLMKKKNEFIYYSQEAERHAANVGIQLERQSAAIYSMVSVLQQHTDRELAFSKEIIQALGENQTVFAKSDVIDTAMRQIYRIYHTVPKISGDPMYKTLMNEIKREAEVVATEKKRYTSAASSYNKRISMAPYSLFAKLWGFRKKELFQTSAGIVYQHKSGAKENVYEPKNLFK
ncbi:MAG: LemA family protein [Methanimicrococcus sp.]|nr:LemA family protein [Methanimicrococcus sp.]